AKKTGRFREPPRIQELENLSVFLWSSYCRLIVPAFSQQVLSTFDNAFPVPVVANICNRLELDNISVNSVFRPLSATWCVRQETSLSFGDKQ
ncbi:MAG: hypothetical protein WCK00_11070, partial [Deltaproteobacteria bacterium]